MHPTSSSFHASTTPFPIKTPKTIIKPLGQKDPPKDKTIQKEEAMSFTK